MMKRNTIITVCAAAVLCIGMALCLQGCRSKAADTVLPEAKSAVIVAAEKQLVESERTQEQQSEAVPELAAKSKAQVDKTDVVEPKEDQQKQAEADAVDAQDRGTTAEPSPAPAAPVPPPVTPCEPEKGQQPQAAAETASAPTAEQTPPADPPKEQPIPEQPKQEEQPLPPQQLEQTDHAENGWQPTSTEHYHGNGTECGVCPACGLCYGPGNNDALGPDDGIMG